MRLVALVLVLVFAAIIVSGATVLLHELRKSALPPDTTGVPYLFTVSESLGVDVGTDIFRLGALKPGTSSYRSLSISDAFMQTTGNQYRVRVWARGKGSEWLIIEPSEATTPAEVRVTAAPPAEAPLGEYRGYIYVTRLFVVQSTEQAE